MAPLVRGGDLSIDNAKGIELRVPRRAVARVRLDGHILGQVWAGHRSRLRALLGRAVLSRPHSKDEQLSK
eukprot:9082925-Pyramimonas_sp.AAC.1